MLDLKLVLACIICVCLGMFFISCGALFIDTYAGNGANLVTRLFGYQ